MVQLIIEDCTAADREVLAYFTGEWITDETPLPFVFGVNRPRAAALTILCEVLGVGLDVV